LWDVASGKLMSLSRGHTDTVDSIAFSPDGRRLASVGRDRQMLVWEVPTGKQVWAGMRRLPERGGPSRVAFSPDGRQLTWAGEGSLSIYDAEKGDILREIQV